MIPTNDVLDEMARTLDLLDTGTEEYAKTLIEAAEADAAFKREYAKALLIATGTVEARKAQAEVETADLYAHKRVSEALRESQRSRLEHLKARLDSLRTMASSSRALEKSL